MRITRFTRTLIGGATCALLSLVASASVYAQNALVQAEDFNSHYDTTAGNTGGAYRSDGVDIEATADNGGGYNVGWMANGEWLEYNVTLSAGTYRIATRVASETGGGNYTILMNGNSVGSKTVDATGGWQNWLTQIPGEVTVRSGTHTLRVNVSGGNFNLNWISVEFISGASDYLTKAQQTHNFIVGNLLTEYGSYRANLTTHKNNSWQWYNISNVYAAAEMVRQGDSRYLAYMNNTYNFMGIMWDSSSRLGGYFSSVNLNGTNAGGDKFVDDNSLAGLIYLDSYRVPGGTQSSQYLNSAVAVANWLMNAGVWDYTYNGGFWWNDGSKNVAPNVKPTQTNGLAMRLFIELYGITGQSYYLSWANSIKSWLESEMYDDADGLFIWQIEPGGTKRYEKFTYDNAIMIEAYLAFYKVTGENSYLTKAQNLGISLNTVLWDYSSNVYKFNTADPRVNPAWCGWASQAMIKLYEADGNTAWLDYAQYNIDFINNFNRNPVNHGYRFFTNLDGSVSDDLYEAVDQAWMQRIQGMLSKYR